jgi:hypothetical protein
MLQSLQHFGAVQFFVGLNPQRVYGGSFAFVKHTTLDECFVCIFCHFAAKRVYFAHKMALAAAAYVRIAGHKRYGVQMHGEHNHTATHACRGQGGLTACVPAAHHGDVVNGVNEQSHPEKRNCLPL